MAQNSRGEIREDWLEVGQTVLTAGHCTHAAFRNVKAGVAPRPTPAHSTSLDGCVFRKYRSKTCLKRDQNEL